MAPLTAAELEKLLEKQFGPDFREKAIVGPMGSFRLSDSFAECGLEDPSYPAPSAGYGLWQFSSGSKKS